VAEHLEGGPRAGSVPLGQDPDGALGGDPCREGVFQLGHRAFERGDPCVDGIGRHAGHTGRSPRRAAGGAVGLHQDAEFLGDEVGEREPLDEVGRRLVAVG
jgi:hypothetical protein